ncbi:restriction endonuclease subunit S [Exiguobacterium sp. NPDC077395]|uniref:restriction endonuclease subunit S n=1 Tax=Exiguobacterium sp. NPDC077395 TaxID=3390563 RepID=UPI003D022B7D
MTYPLVRMKFIADEKLMYGANESAELDDRDLPRYIRITDLNSEGNLKEDTFKSLEWEKAKPYLLRKGDILFARSGATVGKAYIHETGEPACYAGYLIKLKVDLKKCLPKFVFYYTQTNKYAAWIAENTIQATIQNVSAEKYANLFLPLPSLKLQEIIIKYLENNVAHIDGLIAKKIKYIDLLEQQRQSIITEAVTKGLNPNVKMKDSGVKWIGEIPEKWKNVKLGWYISIFGSVEISGGYFTAPFFKVNDLNMDKGKLVLSKSNGMVENNTPPITGKKILIPKRGAAIFTNKVRVIYEDCYIDSNLMAIVPKKELKIKYLAYLLWARKLGDIADTSTIPQINNKQINPLKVPLPSIEEQSEIVRYIEHSSDEILNLIRNIENQINNLKEYRQALIYEAVTGKIDVRDMELD